MAGVQPVGAKLPAENGHGAEPGNVYYHQARPVRIHPLAWKRPRGIVYESDHQPGHHADGVSGEYGNRRATGCGDGPSAPAQGDSDSGSQELVAGAAASGFGQYCGDSQLGFSHIYEAGAQAVWRTGGDRQVDDGGRYSRHKEDLPVDVSGLG